MQRKHFIKKLGIGMVSAPMATSFIACSKEDDTPTVVDPNACAPTPTEIAGPFPIKSPADRIRENIVGNKAGIPLVINFTVQNTNNNCEPLAGVFVDLWHCDAKGNYSEYDGQLEGDFTAENFLRGRQTTDQDGKVNFVSIYPGWYPGRAPHLHVEIKSGNRSLLITQLAFPEAASKTVYATQAYKGDADTTNAQDGEFADSLAANMPEKVSGNTTNGYTLEKVIKVAG